MAKYRKKSIVVEARQWHGEPDTEFRHMRIDRDERGTQHYRLILPTPEGNLFASEGDWIIKDENGAVYPCKPDIFEKTYELAE